MALGWPSAGPGDPLTHWRPASRAKTFSAENWPRLCANTSWRSRHRLATIAIDGAGPCSGLAIPDRGEKALRRSRAGPRALHPRWHYGCLPCAREISTRHLQLSKAAEADEPMQAPLSVWRRRYLAAM
jgi:hypothetical protein